MAQNFHVDLSHIRQRMRRAPNTAGRGARKGLESVKDDWVHGIRDIAPLDTGNLRRQVNGVIEGQAMELDLIVSANASRNGFNYAYYIHSGQMAADGKRLRHPGTVEQFFDESMNEEVWKRWIEQDIIAELESVGW